MGYIPPEMVEKARRMDLLTYLQTFEPGELVHVSGDTYATATHDSLRISNGKWCWFSRGIGGRSALDYLVKVKGCSFLEAVETLSGFPCPETRPVHRKEPAPKRLLLPERAEHADRVIEYLKGRGICREVLEFCLETGRLYENRNGRSAVFVGMDKEGRPRYAAIRGMGETGYKGDASGSDKHFSFSIPGKCGTLQVFEGAVDVLSYATLQILDKKDWRQEHLLSLGGVYVSKRPMEQRKLPAALKQYLQDHPEIRTVITNLEDDRAGREAALAIERLLPEKYRVSLRLPLYGKDVNDTLCHRLGLPIVRTAQKGKKREEER